MPVKKYVRKNIYGWHRITSLIVALPILLWSVSGFLHPVMNSFKPEVRNQFLPTAAIDCSKIHIPLEQALHQNSITVLHNFRIIKFDSTYYYQIQQLDNDTLTYISCLDGTLLKDGDQLYASYLAQRYLSEPIAKDKSPKKHSHQMNADINELKVSFDTTGSFVKTKIIRTELIKKFDGDYKSSDVLLPVYKVSFNRPDGIRLYVETSSDRLAAAVDNKKAWFINFFAFAHTWSFLNGLGETKNVVLGVFSLLCFLTSVFGYIVYNIINRKKNASSSKTWHRTLGNVFVLTTALYGISGSWHAFHKFSEKPQKEVLADRSQFSASDLTLSLADLQKHVNADEKFTNVSIVKMNGESYWQLFVSKGRGQQKKYISSKTSTQLADGDMKYGCSLACSFSGNPAHVITHKKCLTAFTTQYSMMNKRLPVIEVAFHEDDRYYVETSTGKLSAVTNAYDKAERFSFSNLHMHHYWESSLGDSGKTIQKTVLICSTLGLLLLAITGLIIYCCKRVKSLK